MPSGGARAGAGRKPDPNALRRQRDGKEWVKLRPEGRGDAPAPEWPLMPDAAEAAEVEFLTEKIGQLREDWGEAEAKAARSIAAKLDKAERELAILTARIAGREKQERELWERLWKLPQAAVWEADSTVLQVGLYTRAFLDAQRPGAGAAERTLAARLAGELLLTTPSLHAMRYVIDTTLSGAAPADLVGEAAARPKATTSTGGRSRFQVVRDEEETA